MAVTICGTRRKSWRPPDAAAAVVRGGRRMEEPHQLRAQQPAGAEPDTNAGVRVDR